MPTYPDPKHPRPHPGSHILGALRRNDTRMGVHFERLDGRGGDRSAPPPDPTERLAEDIGRTLDAMSRRIEILARELNLRSHFDDGDRSPDSPRAA